MTVAPVSDESLATLLARYVSAWESADVGALLSVIREDACLSMPPRAVWFRGHEHIGAFLRSHGQAGWLRMVPTGANGQPAFALYARDPAGTYRAFGLTILTVAGALVAESITFIGPHYMSAFELPPSL